MAIESELLFSMLRDVVTCVSVGAMIFGGVVPFLLQYIKIRKSRDPEGFSTYVCLVLLIAYILRVCFWSVLMNIINKAADVLSVCLFVCPFVCLSVCSPRFGVHYEWPLLTQSMLMIVTMLLMIHLCVRVREENDTPHRIWGEEEEDGHSELFSLSPPSLTPPLSLSLSLSLSDFNPQFFWQWSHFLDYLIFLFVLALTMVTLSLSLIRVKPFVELLGFASLLTEASLGVPQFLRNLKHRSTQGMRCVWSSTDSIYWDSQVT